MLKARFFIAIGLLIIMSGCGDSDKPQFTQEQMAVIPLPPRTNLPNCSGGMVMAVGNETITSREVVEPMVEVLGSYAKASDIDVFREKSYSKVQAYLINKISNMLLYQQAKRSAGDQIDDMLDKLADAEVKKFIVSFGGDYAKAEEEIKKNGMDWESFKEFQKKTILGQNYIATNMSKPKSITYNELADEYEKMKEEHFVKKGTITIRLIDIQPDNLTNPDPNRPLQQQAKELADKLDQRIRNGEDFGKLAEEYSQDYSKQFGGLWKPRQPESLAEPYDVLGKQAEKMKVGDIAGPIETEEHIFIIKLEGREASTVEPFEKVQKQIEAKIDLERRRDAIEALSKELVQKASLHDMEGFINFCITEIYEKSNQKI